MRKEGEEEATHGKLSLGLPLLYREGLACNVYPCVCTHLPVYQSTRVPMCTHSSRKGLEANCPWGLPYLLPPARGFATEKALPAMYTGLQELGLL